MIRQLLSDGLIACDGIDQRLAIPHQFLRSIRIVPQCRVFNTSVEFFQAMGCSVPLHSLRQQRQTFFNFASDRLDFSAHV